jgi:hypothetical protein
MMGNAHPGDVFLNLVELVATTESDERAIHDAHRSDCLEVKVHFDLAHARCLSTVDLAIGQDRRKRGLGAFMITIEPDTPFEQRMIEADDFDLQMGSRNEFKSISTCFLTLRGLAPIWCKQFRSCTRGLHVPDSCRTLVFEDGIEARVRPRLRGNYQS